MTNCARCKCNLPERSIICAPCFHAWPKGKDLSEYLKIPYNPKPVVIPTGVSTTEDYPI